MNRPPLLVALALAWAAGLVVSGWAPHDRLTWLMEVAPAIVALPILWTTARRFPLSGLLTALILAHGLVLMLGGAYTYARVPFGFWLQEALGLARNPYDRVGHFWQGLVPALLARELLLRLWLARPRWLVGLLAICVALAVSASYELIEWGAALALGEGADSFLGTQGDPWDTQGDIFMALLGALVATLALARAHDRSMAKLG